MRKAIEIMLGGLVVVGLGGCAEMNPSDTGPVAEEAVAGQTAALSQDRASGASHDDDGPDRRLRCPRVVPAALNPPADVTLEAGMSARGVQIYICAAPAAGGAPVWALKAPHAVLFQGQETAAIHFAGPSWQALDGSLVTGARIASAPAPDAVSIPWLLLAATSSGAPGLFADVTWIQRLATVGGAAPATDCDADHLNAQVLIPYTADYFFYHPAVAGKPVHQCAGV